MKARNFHNFQQRATENEKREESHTPLLEQTAKKVEVLDFSPVSLFTIIFMGGESNLHSHVPNIKSVFPPV